MVASQFGSTVMVVGSEGYLGSVLVPFLRDTGYLVDGIDAQWFTGLGNIAGDAIDVRNFSLKALPAQPEAIVYLAAVSNDPMGATFAEATRSINVEAAVKLATEAKALGVRRFVFASSCSIYGHAGLEKKNETDALDPITAYAASKVEAERRLGAISGPGFQVSCLRFATACGFSPNLRLDLVLNDFVASAVQLGKISILSDGTPWRPLINVSDIARAIEWALRHPHDYESIAINVGSEDFTYTIRNLAEVVSELIPGTELEISAAPALDSRSYKVDFTLFQQMAPDAQPRRGIEDTVRELEAQVRLLDFGDEGFRYKAPYIRLSALQQMVESGSHDELLARRAV